MYRQTREGESKNIRGHEYPKKIIFGLTDVCAKHLQRVIFVPLCMEAENTVHMWNDHWEETPASVKVCDNNEKISFREFDRISQISE